MPRRGFFPWDVLAISSILAAAGSATINARFDAAAGRVAVNKNHMHDSRIKEV